MRNLLNMILVKSYSLRFISKGPGEHLQLLFDSDIRYILSKSESVKIY